MERKNEAILLSHTWEELRELVIAAGKRTMSCGIKGDGDPWLGRPSGTIADAMRNGEPERARQAEKLFDRAIEAVLPETAGGRSRPTPDVAGYSPRVGAYLAGQPRCMRRRKRSESLGPVRIYVDLACSSGVSAGSQLARGIAVAALAYAVQLSRPVELWGVVGARPIPFDEDVIHTFPLGTRPLDLSRVALAVSEIGIPRRVMFFEGPARGWGGKSGVLFPRKPVRETLGLGPDDIYVQPLHLSEESQWADDPIGKLLKGLENQLQDAGIVWQND